MISIKIASTTNRDISLPTEAANNMSRAALPLQPPDIFKTDITSSFLQAHIAVWYGEAARQEETDPLVIIAEFYTVSQKNKKKDLTVITLNFMTEREQASISVFEASRAYSIHFFQYPAHPSA